MLYACLLLAMPAGITMLVCQPVGCHLVVQILFIWMLLV